MDIKQIRWQCRRGMLELDMLLIPFCDQCFAVLTQQEQQQFIDLLSSADTELFDWLLGYAEPPQTFQMIVTKIRSHAKNKH